MGHYLVERYHPATGHTALADDAARLRATAGGEVRLLLTLYSTDDETCFHLFDASTYALVEAAGRTAGLVLDRIVPVIEVPQQGAGAEANRSAEAC